MESKLLDDDQANEQFQDKKMIRNNFPDVTLFEDIFNEGYMDYNLLLFGIAAKSSFFISVQGGNSIVASLWGSPNYIYAVKGSELSSNSYNSIYKYFGESDIWTTNNKTIFLNKLQSLS